MDNLRSILVVVDPGATAHPCVLKASRVAAGFHARLELVICDFEPVARASQFYDGESFELARTAAVLPHRELLETLAESPRRAGLTVDTTVIFENPLHKGLMEQIRRSKPDLVVKDTHHHAVIRRTLITNTDWHLIRGCPAPLLLVKAAAWPAGPLTAACAVDPGHPDDKPWSLDHEIIGAVEYLATGLPLKISVVNAFSTITEVINAAAGGMPETVLISADVIESARKEQLAKLLKLSAGHHVDRDRIHLVDGAAVEALPAFVERERIDLLAMGAVSRGGFFDLFIGGTAETVLERLACDVVIIKPARLAGPMWRGERMDDTGNSA